MELTKRRRRLRSPEERVGTLPNADLPPPATVPQDDEALLERALHARDEAAFRIVFERLYPAMIRLAERHVRTRAEAEDVVQDAWLGAMRGITRFQGRSALKTWLFRILRNRARTAGVRGARTISITALPEAATAEAPPAAGRLLRHELRGRLEAALRTLPARQREVVTLRDVEGWSADEVCHVLRLSPANQRVLLHRGRLRLRAVLQPWLDAAGWEAAA